MAVTLKHTINHARDKEKAARFLTGIIGLAPHQTMGHFAIVQFGEISLDFIDADGDIASRDFAFLVGEEEFDQIFGRIRKQGLACWADPARRQPGEINRRDDGRGVYFTDPNGHFLEIITRHHGSGGLGAKHPNPLLARP